MSKERETLTKVEVKRIDPWQWALLHLPLGVMLGIWFTVWFVKQEHPGSPETPITILAGTPIVTGLTWCFAWLQAQLCNVFFRLMRNGPILEVVTSQKQ